MPSFKELYEPVARLAARENNINENIFCGLITIESKWNPNAVNPDSGAAGIAQIMRIWHPGVNVFNPIESLYYSAKLIRSYLNVFNGDYDWALASYHMGISTVTSMYTTSGQLPFYELRNYVYPVHQLAMECVIHQPVSTSIPSAIPRVTPEASLFDPLYLLLPLLFALLKQ
jgi:soluble lytic murein transglycosylase-like protein